MCRRSAFSAVLLLLALASAAPAAEAPDVPAALPATPYQPVASPELRPAPPLYQPGVPYLPAATPVQPYPVAQPGPAAVAQTVTSNVLSLVPDSAMAVLVVNKPAAFDEKLEGFARLMHCPAAHYVLPFVKSRLKLKEGVDESRPMALAIFDVPVRRSMATGSMRLPPALLFVPVKDFSKLIASGPAYWGNGSVVLLDAGETKLLARYESGYAIVGDASSMRAVEIWRSRPSLATSDPLPGVLDVLLDHKPAVPSPSGLARWTAWVAEGDAAVVLSSTGVAQLTARAMEEFDRIKSALPQENEQARMAANVFDVYRGILQAAQGEITGVGLRLRLDDDHTVRLDKRVEFRPGGAWERLLAKAQPSGKNLIAGLPAGPFVFAMGTTHSQAVSRAFAGFYGDFLRRLKAIYGLNDEQIGKLQEFMARGIPGFEGMALLLATGGKDEPVYSRVAGLLRVKDAEAFFGEYEKLVERYNEVMRSAENSIFQPLRFSKVVAESIAHSTPTGGDVTIESPMYAVSMPFPKLPVPMANERTEKVLHTLFGPGDAIKAFLAKADERQVVIGYVEPKRMIDAVRAIQQDRPSLAGDEQIEKTAAMLPRDALAVAYVSPQGLVQAIDQIRQAFRPAGAQDIEWPAFPATAPIGWALAKDGNKLDASLVIPGEVFTAGQRFAGEIVAKVATRRAEQIADTMQRGGLLQGAGAARGRSPGNPPLTLDFAKYYTTTDRHRQMFGDFFKEQEIDGLPFAPLGLVQIWGGTNAQRWPTLDRPKTISGIPVGRTFDELHLIHAAQWPDAEDRIIAYYVLNYADGTKAILPIRYGANVLDWYYLTSFDQETPTAPETKICWTHPPFEYKAPLRIFKSVLENPEPKKKVDSIDLVSGRGLSSYVLMAATVADKDAKRAVTPAVAMDVAKREFDGKLTIRVVDAKTGQPVAGALIQPSGFFQGQGVVAQPLFTSAEGEAVLRYPTEETAMLWMTLTKEGYRSGAQGFERKRKPESVTIKLQPDKGGFFWGTNEND